ncbi:MULTISPECIES: ATP-binding protein [unclassified Nocardioides]|uniref:sensor histidine kinase n=1 Tax=unclassified Nocardioides TaxID=2615069 RepID=UPI0003142CA2|nr:MULTISPECIES: ATP-binding protein [unclassified Nocardioides]
MVRHLCWNGGEPDPRVLQSSFTLILAIALGFRIAAEGPVAPLSWPVAGVVIAIVGSLIVLTAPAPRVDVLARALAVVHIAALGMLAQGSELGIASGLVVFPSIWLGLELGQRGVALATGATVAFIAVPGLVSRGAGVAHVEWLLLLTILAGFSAFATDAALIAARTAQARAEAREAELAVALKVKEDFVALVSHELRTPLTSIVGYVAVALERDDLDPVLRTQLDAVDRNGKRLERLVQDLLDEVQHSGRPLPLREQDTDLAVIVRECVAGARLQAARGGVRLDADVPDSIAFTGDPERLAQVVDNLVSNAIKYTEPGGSARVQAIVVADGSVRISVQDTGIGIDPAERARLFSRFFRGAEASRRAIQGIGLGLSITKSIVESHGGRIEVDSEPGRGSEFRVVLPSYAAQLAS